VQLYVQAGIPTTVLLDSARGYIIEGVDLLGLGGSQSCCGENGGIVKKLGMYALATCPKEHRIPFYVASESHKFATASITRTCHTFFLLSGYSMFTCDDKL
jgi:translation initiation factor eIF-2B subunit alpha